jgi:hypothetical protein
VNLYRRLIADGVIWKSPTGKTYKSLPCRRIFFPACDTTTAPPPRLSHVVQERINEVRALSDTHVAERNRPPPF